MPLDSDKTNTNQIGFYVLYCIVHARRLTRLLIFYYLYLCPNITLCCIICLVVWTNISRMIQTIVTQWFIITGDKQYLDIGTVTLCLCFVFSILLIYRRDCFLQSAPSKSSNNSRVFVCFRADNDSVTHFPLAAHQHQHTNDFLEWDSILWIIFYDSKLIILLAAGQGRRC